VLILLTAWIIFVLVATSVGPLDTATIKTLSRAEPRYSLSWRVRTPLIRGGGVSAPDSYTFSTRYAGLPPKFMPIDFPG
jgi:hypothetical protein